MRTDGAAVATGLDPRRIAEVIVTAGKGGRRGSGYRVGNAVVLTAFHVVSGAAGVQVRFEADRPGQWSAPAEVVWSDTATDVAVLAFTPPAGAEPVGPAPFGRIGDDRHAVVDVHAAGFPLWKRRRDAEGRQFRELHQADGTVAALSNLRTGTLEVTVSVAAADPDPQVSPWSGMSGSALWAGSRIVGVIAEHHRWEGPGRLTAARLDHTLRRVGEPLRTRLAELLGIGDPLALPDARSETGPGRGPGRGPQRASSLRVIGLPVTHGLELFKDRIEARELVGRHLADPAVRMVTVTGRRGMGKSALSAKVLEMLEQGQWPGQTRAPLPSAIVNLSTRTSGVTLERLYFDCARALGPETEARLLGVWAANRPVHDKVGELFNAMGDELVVILVDNLEDLLLDDGRLEDAELGVFFDCLFRNRHTPRLLVTSQIPLRLAPELRRFAVEVELSEGLPAAESIALLRELDQDGSLGVAQLSDEELLRAAVRVHGVPRALELLMGAMADDVLELPTLRDVLEDFTLREDVVSGLAQDRYRRLGPETRVVVDVLSVLRTPASRDAIDWIVGALAPGLDVAGVMSQLLRIRMLSVDRPNRTYALHPLDADLAYGALPRDGALGRRSLERQAADWYAQTAPARERWRGLEDVRAHRRAFEHRRRAGDMNEAALVLGAIGPWMTRHGSALAAIAMHLTLEDKLTDDAARLAHLISYGHARLSGGPLAHAVTLFTEAAEVAERLGDRQALQDALFGLGDAHRQLGSLEDGAAALSRAAVLAGDNGDTEAEAHAVLSLSLAHSTLGHGPEALAGAERLNAIAAESRDPLTEARAWNARFTALLTMGSWEETIAASDRAVDAYQVAGVREATDYALNAKGVAQLALGRHAEAVASLEAAFQAASAMENPRTEGVCLYNLAWTHWTGDRYEEAAGTADRSAASFQRAGSPEGAAAQALADAARARAAGDLAVAAEALERAAAGVGRNVETVRPAWLTREARTLRDTA
ncbi:trypsin-like peptidase domain-containing protein [Streptomyces goshikiensis]|uniref:trypsin-like peptidase domain-containing protein n=1 Tax=Streptomyces goshikiensis TaxID=1942 RepID=UPI0036519039